MKKMTGKAKIIAVCLIALLALVVVPYIPQVEPLPTGSIQGIARAELPLAEPPPVEPKPEEPKPEEPPPEEPPPEEVEPPPVEPPPEEVEPPPVEPPPIAPIQEIQKQIDLVRAKEIHLREVLINMTIALAAGDVAAAVVQLRVALTTILTKRMIGQMLVDWANKYYGTNVTGAVFNPSLRDAYGVMRPDCSIKIGSGAFRSPGWLASIKIHEGRHREQKECRLSDEPGYWDECSALYHLTEIDAYQAQLAAAGRIGLTQAEIDEIQARIEEHERRSGLTEAEIATGLDAIRRRIEGH